jgi:hypothetical protein
MKTGQGLDEIIDIIEREGVLGGQGIVMLSCRSFCFRLKLLFCSIQQLVETQPLFQDIDDKTTPDFFIFVGFSGGHDLFFFLVFHFILLYCAGDKHAYIVSNIVPGNRGYCNNILQYRVSLRSDKLFIWRAP